VDEEWIYFGLSDIINNVRCLFKHNQTKWFRSICAANEFEKSVWTNLSSTVTIVSWTLAKDLEDDSTVNLNYREVICVCVSVRC
jgi:hypothetical protein